MTDIPCDVAVIGAGTAGLAAWRAATDAGALAVIVEAGPGGTTCARIGCMPSKLLIAAGAAARDSRRAGTFGIRTGAVAVDGPAVLARVRRERDYFVDAVMKDYHAIPADRRIAGRARFAAADRLTIDGVGTVAARAVVIAVGSSPVVPGILDGVADHVRTSDTIFEIADLPASLAVLGAGAIGLELAAAFARLGTRVTVIDKGDGIANLDDRDAEACARAMLSRDIAFRLGAELTAAKAGGDGVHLTWDGDDAGSDRFAMILAAAGRPPSVAGLDLAATGLDLDDDGVPHFDPATGRCGGSRIFIAGDARACRPVLHEASRSGTLAGRNAARPGDPARDAILPPFSVTYTDPQIVRVGRTAGDLPDGAVTGRARFADNGRVHIMDGGDGLLNLHVGRDGALLGATIVGMEAEQIGHLVAMALTAGMDVRTLADQAYYHPTVAEILQSAARDAADRVDRPA